MATDWSKKTKAINHRVGELSSIYAYNPEQFEKDVVKRAEQSEELYRKFKAWMIENKVDPEKLRHLFLRMWEEFLQD